MKKTIFIIPGWTESPSDPGYKWLRKYFAGQGFHVKIIKIQWKNLVITDYVRQFEEYYEKHKADVNYVLGFSFGAMTAYISAPNLKPDKLYLCSLSPYFYEDMHGVTLKKSWQKMIGKNRLKDFLNHKSRRIAKQVPMETVVFLGTKEAKHSSLRDRCIQVSDWLEHGYIVHIPDAPHDIAHPNYREAIKKHIK